MTRPRGPGGQKSIRDSGTLLPAPEGQGPYCPPGPLTPTRPRVPATRPSRARGDAGRSRRRSSAAGTDDPYCHIFVGSPPFRYTSCGQRLDPPLPVKKTHRKPPCPNGHPPCPECVRVRAEDDGP